MRYLRNQQARVCWDGEKGQYLFIDQGVRQGGILSPFLFKLYIDKVIQKISQTNVGCSLGYIRVNILAYADELFLIGNSIYNSNKLYIILTSEID